MGSSSADGQMPLAKSCEQRHAEYRSCSCDHVTIPMSRSHDSHVSIADKAAFTGRMPRASSAEVDLVAAGGSRAKTVRWLFSNSESRFKLSHEHPCRVQGFLRSRGLPSA